MADIFGGIFDSVSSLFDSRNVMNALGAAGKTAFGSSPKAPTMSDLTYGADMGVSSTFNSSKTGAVESVNPDNFEAVWKARLQKFAEIESTSGVKLK